MLSSGIGKFWLPLVVNQNLSSLPACSSLEGDEQKLIFEHLQGLVWLISEMQNLSRLDVGDILLHGSELGSKVVDSSLSVEGYEFCSCQDPILVVLRSFYGDVLGLFHFSCSKPRADIATSFMGLGSDPIQLASPAFSLVLISTGMGREAAVSAIWGGRILSAASLLPPQPLSNPSSCSFKDFPNNR